MPHTGTSSRGWQADVHVGLHGLLQSRASLLRPRPATWGSGTPALAAHLGAIALADGIAVPYSTQERTALERRAQAGLLAHFQGHLHCIRGRGGPGTTCSRLELYFLETPEAEEAQLRACDDQILTVPAEGSQPALQIPVSLAQGQLVSPHLCQLTLHGLPPSLAREGIGHSLLSMAGYEQHEYTVEGEFMGDLPAHVASQQPAARVGNADACLIYVRPLLADHRFSRLPKSFMVGEDRVQISRPGQQGLMPSQVQPASAGSHAVTLREGPRPIRTRQRAQRAARRAAQMSKSDSGRTAQLPEPATRRAAQAQQLDGGQSAGQPGPLGHAAAPQPQSAALQQLEAAVARSRHGRSDRRGLGSRPAASVAAPHMAAFVAGAASSQLQDMDCTPPVPALLLPARGHAIDMDIDTAQLQNGTVASPQPMQIERPQMPSAVRDELMEWMESHTALSMQHSRAAIAQLLSRMPHLLMAQPIPQLVYAALRDIDDAETQRQLRAESRPVRQRCHSPAVPPGFELQAAHSAVARATTGLRRSSRASRPPAAYWMAQPSGRMASSQRPGSQ